MDSRPGFIAFRATGEGASRLFANESGGHRWQRVPPTEKRGRVQTSTVTVAVLREPTEQEVQLNESDLEIQAVRGSGPGGQARNKTASAIVIRHRPSGLMVRCDTTRSQPQNRATALSMLRAKLLDAKTTAVANATNDSRREQVGSGMRGDKVRTYRSQDDVVTDHRTGKKARLRDVVRGDFDRLV